MKQNEISEIFQTFDALILLLENAPYNSVAQITKGLKYVFLKELQK